MNNHPEVDKELLSINGETGTRQIKQSGGCKIDMDCQKTSKKVKRNGQVESLVTYAKEKNKKIIMEII